MPVFDDEHDARAARQRLLAEQRERMRAEFNRHFPVCAAKAREIDRIFGPGVSIVFAIEAGRMIGPVPEEEIQKYESEYGPLQRLRLRDPGDQGHT